MPVLKNPRWERFAQAIVAGILSDKPFSQGRAYQVAGYSAKDAGQSGGSAEACASRLLKKAKPIIDRVAELQDIAAAKALTSAAVTIDTIKSEYDEARQFAYQCENPSTVLAATRAKAELFGIQINRTEITNRNDLTANATQSDIARKLLNDIG